jgi:RHS repeat-associated protein
VTEYHYDANGNIDCLTTAAGSPATCPESVDETGTNHDSALLGDYAHDGLDRLVAYRSWQGTTSPSNSASYTYDAFDRVVKQIETHGMMSDTTTFTYLGLSNLIAREDRVGAHPKVREYAYDAYGVRVAMIEDPGGAAPQHFTYGYDVHGSVSLLITDQGSGQPSVQASYGYAPYGSEDKGLTTNAEELTNAGGTPNNFTPVNPFRYTGKRYDSGSATLDMGARRFGPEAARFLSVDLSMGALSGLSLSTDPLSQNRYSLASGNPLSFIEWDGHRVTLDGAGRALRGNDRSTGFAGGRIENSQPWDIFFNECRRTGGTNSSCAVDADYRAAFFRDDQEHLERELLCAIYDCPGFLESLWNFFTDDIEACVGSDSSAGERTVGCIFSTPWGKLPGWAKRFARGARFGDELIDSGRLSSRFRRAFDMARRSIPLEHVENILPTFRRVLDRRISFPGHDAQEFFDWHRQLGTACDSGCTEWVVGIPGSGAKLRDLPYRLIVQGDPFLPSAVWLARHARTGIATDAYEDIVRLL